MNKLLLKKGTLLIFAIISAVLFLVWGVYNVCTGNYQNGLYAVIYAALIVSILISYKKCDTNCQKALIGILLMFIARDELDFCYYILSNQSVFTAVDSVLTVSIVVLFAIYLINYVLTLSDHIGEKYMSLINNIVLAMLFVLYTIYVIRLLIGGYLNDAIALKAGELTTVVMISCISMRVQTYKRIRAAAILNGTWDKDARKEAKKLFAL